MTAGGALRAQEFRLGEYRVHLLFGEAGLLPGRDYVSFAGDTGFREGVPGAAMRDRRLDAEAPLLSRFALNVVNLEYGAPGVSGRDFDHEIDRVTVDTLRRLDYRLVSVANNHAMDWGLDGARYNADLLRRSGFELIGLRQSPVYLWNSRFGPVAIYSLTAYTDERDPASFVLTLDEKDLAFVQSLVRGAKYRIAFVHLGSMSSFPSAHERSEVGRLLDHGADMVVCTGSHFLKGFLRENGKPVVYGLGDHLFSSVNPGTESVGMHFVAGFGPSGLEQLFVVPFRNDISRGRAGPLGQSDFLAFERTLKERSTANPDRYFSDPRSFSVLKQRLTHFRFSDLRDLRPRKVLYAVQILWRHSPVGLTVVLLLACGLAIFFVARRARPSARGDGNAAASVARFPPEND